MSRVLTCLLLTFGAAAAGCGGELKTREGDTSGIWAGGAQGDADGDGWSDEEDCGPDDPSISPAVSEVCDGVDNDCDGSIDEGTLSVYYADADGDGFGDADAETVEACEPPAGYVPNNTDCDDSNDIVYPGAPEECDFLDNDCDGEVDDGVTNEWYADADGDGFGDPDMPAEGCAEPTGHVHDATDCDDTQATVYPGAEEVCDELDNDCDGGVDEMVTTTYYQDVDGDGWGDPTSVVDACFEPPGYAETPGDCDDTESTVHPGASELCNLVDDDCDGVTDEDPIDGTTYYTDADVDGFGDAELPVVACSAPSGTVEDATDCDDADAAQYPGADEWCNGEDDDCDGLTDESDAVDAATWHADSDGDGFGDPDATTSACSEPTGYTADAMDCDDTDAAVSPAADEYCNGIDDNCDGTVDEDSAVDAQELAVDFDGDGFGAEGSTALSCEGVDNELDCDDTDSTEPLWVDLSTGSSAGPGTSTAPYDTIQGGIDNAVGCVVVAAGTYDEAIDFDGQDIAVRSIDGADVTVIDATGLSAPAVTFDSGETSGAELNGFTLTGGEGALESTSSSRSCGSGATCTDYYDSYCGGGLYLDGADPDLIGLIVEANVLPDADSTSSGNDTYYTFSYGGGVCFMDSQASLVDVEVLDNYADQGGGVFVDELSDILGSQVAIHSNEATDGGGVEIDSGSLTLTNALAAWNEAEADGGGLLVLDGTLDLTNGTISHNIADAGGALYLSGSATGTVDSSILSWSLYGEGVYGDSGATYTGTYSNVSDNYGGDYSGVTDPTGSAGNISADPQFTDAPSLDFSLVGASPSVDAGDPSAAMDDFDGTSNDQGAFGGPDGIW